MDIDKYKKKKRTFSGTTRDRRTLPEIITSKENSINYMIEFIKDDHLSEKVKDIMTNDVPDYFWTKPSSSSGKYHPFDERGKFGLVLHTCRVTKVTDDLCVAAQVNDVNRNDLIVAAILHDSFKYDLPPGNPHTVKLHCIIPGEQLDITDMVNQLIRTHDGQWGLPDEWKDADDHQKLLHYADYIASRSYVHIRIP
jgi:23S rRNA maturation-related 3'-5' exoribonuclease YhaM